MKFFQFRRERSNVPVLGVCHNGKCYDMGHLAPDMKTWVSVRHSKAEDLATFLERAEKYELQEWVPKLFCLVYIIENMFFYFFYDLLNYFFTMFL